MDRGFIKLWRMSLDSQVFCGSPELWKVWTWCLMRANHKDNWIQIKTGKGYSEINILKGQFVFGRESASKELRLKSSSVRNYMEKLKNIGNLDIKPDNHYSIVTICNYDKYNDIKKETGQATGQAKDRQRTGKGQAKDTDKNVLELKELEELNISPDLWSDFVTMRKTIRKPLTPKAIELIIGKLQKMKNPLEALKQSIERSYPGVFEVKEETKRTSHDAIDEVMEMIKNAEKNSRDDIKTINSILS